MKNKALKLLTVLLVITFFVGCDALEILDPGDTEQPVIITTSPVDGATGVDINTSVSITFSEAIDPTSVTSSSFRLRSSTMELDGTRATVGSVITFTPSSPLEHDAEYVMSASSNISDLAGNPLASSSSIGFKTMEPEVVLPTITSFTPASAYSGDEVVITGTNFSPTMSENIVKFDGRKATVITSTSTTITATVPNFASSGMITVEIGGLIATSANDFTVIPQARVSNFTPTLGVIGAIVNITGSGFSTVIAENEVKFNGVAANVTDATTTQLTVTVPAGASHGYITVKVGSSMHNNNDYFTVIDVGQFYQGGIIGYILKIGDQYWNGSENVEYDANTPHGIIVAISDGSGGVGGPNYSWSKDAVALITTKPALPPLNSLTTALGYGMKNTQDIVASQGDKQITSMGFLYHAAGAAEGYSYDNYYNGWFLPSLDEMEKFYDNRSAINTGAIEKGGTSFSTNLYWTSSTLIYNTFTPPPGNNETRPAVINMISHDGLFDLTHPASEFHLVRAAKYF